MNLLWLTLFHRALSVKPVTSVQMLKNQNTNQEGQKLRSKRRKKKGGKE